MKQWKKKCLCKYACKLSFVSFEMADMFLKKKYLEKFFDKWDKIYQPLKVID